MKKVTSAALLALKLTWKIAALIFLLTGLVQAFGLWQELMPGGVPLQTTFGFETIGQFAFSGCKSMDTFTIEKTPGKDEPAADKTFADVEGHWAKEAVDYVVANGIMSGYNADKFGPDDTLNRAMVVQVLYNREGQPALNGLTHSFSDVPAGQWYNNAVTWGSANKVVSGYGGGLFKPEDAVTIEQVAVILRNYAGSPNGNGDLSKVGSHSDWAADALRWAVAEGILDNVPFTNATEQATRGQTAQMLMNFCK